MIFSKFDTYNYSNDTTKKDKTPSDAIFVLLSVVTSDLGYLSLRTLALFAKKDNYLVFKI